MTRPKIKDKITYGPKEIHAGEVGTVTECNFRAKTKYDVIIDFPTIPEQICISLKKFNACVNCGSFIHEQV